MTDDQSAALINAVTAGFKDVSTSMSKSWNDHDLLIKISTQQEQIILNQEKNHKEFLTHKIESVPIRDDVKENANFRKCTSKALWIIYASLITIAIKLSFIK